MLAHARTHQIHLLVLTETKLPTDVTPPYVAADASSPPLLISGPPLSDLSAYRGGIAVIPLHPSITLARVALPPHTPFPPEHQILPCTVSYRFLGSPPLTVALLPLYSSPTSTLPSLASLYDALVALHTALSRYPTLLMGIRSLHAKLTCVKIPVNMC